ncbi:MAG: hypothetical protein K2Z81_06860 [Cyanobacteria bacterium]|nr:hypothetical protein [Cyanobacteriota bacterium]
MKKSIKKPMTLVILNAIVAVSMPLAASASEKSTIDTSKFQLPINERIESPAPLKPTRDASPALSTGKTGG